MGVPSVARKKMGVPSVSAKKDGCPFCLLWEGRFKTQALLDEAAVLTCMSYVDLNPVRAAMAETPEASDFTSIQQRILYYSAGEESTPINEESATRVPLMPLVKQSKDAHPNALGFAFLDYLELIDWAGRVIREDKRGAISRHAPPILQRLGLDAERYLAHLAGQGHLENPMVIGRYEKIKQLADVLGRRFIKGLGEAKRLYHGALPA